MKVLITGGGETVKVLVTGERKANGQFVKVRTRSWTPDFWDDGWVDNRGKFHVYLPEHPKSSPTGWVFRSWAVWWLETGKIIEHPQALHHINHNGLDDRFENLQLMQAGEHTGHHSRKPLVEKICEVCGKLFGLPQWRINEDRGRWCSLNCYWRSPQSEETKEKRSKSLRRAYAEGKRIPNSIGKRCLTNCRCLRHTNSGRRG